VAWRLFRQRVLIEKCIPKDCKVRRETTNRRLECVVEAERRNREKWKEEGTKRGSIGGVDKRPTEEGILRERKIGGGEGTERTALARRGGKTAVRGLESEGA